MNEQASTQLVQRAYQSIKAGDIQGFLNLLAADVLWEVPEMPNVPFAGTWRGRQEVARFFSIVAEVQDIVEFVPKEFIPHGGKVVVLGSFTMHVKATGKPSRSEWAHVWTIAGGAITSMYEYVDTLAVSRAYTKDSS